MSPCHKQVTSNGESRQPMAVHPRGPSRWAARGAGFLLAAGVFLFGTPAHAILPPPAYGGALPSGGLGTGSGAPIQGLERPPTPAISSSAIFTLGGGSRSNIGREYLLAL